MAKEVNATDLTQSDLNLLVLVCESSPREGELSRRAKPSLGRLKALGWVTETQGGYLVATVDGFEACNVLYRPWLLPEQVLMLVGNLAVADHKAEPARKLLALLLGRKPSPGEVDRVLSSLI